MYITPLIELMENKCAGPHKIAPLVTKATNISSTNNK